jgi:RHS repeat-associated protein
VSWRHYVWDMATLVHEVELADDGSARDVSSYLYLENDRDLPVAQRQEPRDDVAVNAGGWTYLVGDVTGAPDALVDGAGRILAKLERTALGKFSFASGARASTPFRMPGQMEDPETGLHYNRYRYYDPDGGRFISPDPIGFVGGTNLYRYGPNAILWIDPMGWVTTHYAGVRETTPPGVPRVPAFNPANQVAGSRPGSPVYGSGWANPQLNGPCPPGLQTMGGSHSEQKFSQDLINSMGNGRGAGRSFQVNGMYPPCPTCHGAMMRAAANTGADVEYSWMDGDQRQSIRYQGGTGNPSFSGDQANALGAGGYANHQLGPAAPGTSGAYWGFLPGAGSQATYDQMMGPRRVL